MFGYSHYPKRNSAFLGFDITDYSQSGNTFDTSLIVSNPDDVVFGKNGDRVFIVSGAGDKVAQLNLSTADDITSASDSGKSINVNAQETSVKGIDFKPDGTVFFICGLGSNRIVQYNLSTAWELDSASFSGNLLAIGSEIPDNDGRSIRFNDDGSKFFVSGGDNVTGVVAEYDCPTPYSLSGASHSGTTFDTTTEETSPRGIEFTDDGLVMLITGSGSNNINQYNLSATFDISSPTFIDSIAGGAGSVGISFSGDESILILSDNSTDELIEYSI